LCRFLGHRHRGRRGILRPMFEKRQGTKSREVTTDGASGSMAIVPEREAAGGEGRPSFDSRSGRTGELARHFRGWTAAKIVRGAGFQARLCERNRVEAARRRCRPKASALLLQ
jgi:hypothetical protein